MFGGAVDTAETFEGGEELLDANAPDEWGAEVARVADRPAPDAVPVFKLGVMPVGFAPSGETVSDSVLGLRLVNTRTVVVDATWSVTGIDFTPGITPGIAGFIDSEFGFGPSLGDALADVVATAGPLGDAVLGAAAIAAT